MKWLNSRNPYDAHICGQCYTGDNGKELSILKWRWIEARKKIHPYANIEVESSAWCGYCLTFDCFECPLTDGPAKHCWGDYVIENNPTETLRRIRLAPTALK